MHFLHPVKNRTGSLSHYVVRVAGVMSRADLEELREAIDLELRQQPSTVETVRDTAPGGDCKFFNFTEKVNRQ